MAALFRKSSIEKLSSPEQLDRSLTITSPMTWLALIGITLIIAVTVIWSFTGTLPTTTNATGILVNPSNTNAVFASDTGSLEKILVKSGDEIHSGEAIAEIKNSRKETVKVLADQDGVVTQLLVETGTPIVQGTEILRLAPKVDETQVAVFYVPVAQAQELKTGMKVLVTPAFAESQKVGHMEAEITNIDSYASSAANMQYVLGPDNLLSEQFAQNGAVVAVTCRLKTDSSAQNHYYWSSESGKSLSVPNGTILTGKIVIDESAPITKLITGLKDSLEG